MKSSRPLLSLAALLALTPLASALEEPTLGQRLAKLDEALEAAREEHHAAGMSLAIVKDDEVIWARGFGYADVESKRVADEHTLYAIGSTTKAFTATAIGMLADEGKLDWDDPVANYLPYFELAVRSEDENARCTLRDLLSHRSGFSRMGILWFGGQVPREEILRTAAGAEPLDDFRAGFHYCNVTYLAAGEAAGIAAGSSWDELIQSRIFGPLEMNSSSVSIGVAREDSRLATGYMWDETDAVHSPTRLISLDNIAPAGSINSNVLDMAQWIRFQLGRGEVSGKRLISPERLKDTWSPQIAMGNEMDYGLGWMLRKHDGRQVVDHGGNIEGFSAQVSLMPEEGLGYVLLINQSASPVRELSIPIVFDALLDEWPEPKREDGPAVNDANIDLEQFVGVYTANFATFRNEPFTVLNKGDHLAIDIPSQQVLDLKAPDEEGKWYAVLTDRIAASFQRDEQDQVVGLTIHQSGFNFQLPREGHETEPEVPIEELEKFVGIYERANGGKRIKFFVEGGQLMLEDKGKYMPFRVPDANGYATFRARDDFGATFAVDAEDQVDSLVFHGSSGDQLFTRVAGATDQDLPSVEELLALRDTQARLEALKTRGGIKATGTVWIAQAGVRGKLTTYTRGKDRFSNHMDFGKFGCVDSASLGEEAWAYNSMRGFETLKGDMLAQALLEHPGAVEGDWNDYFDSVQVTRTDRHRDRAVYVVSLNKAPLPGRTYWVDAETGDILQVKVIAIENGLRIPVTITHSEFKPMDGQRTATRIEIENPESGRTVMTIEKIESGLDLGDEVFTLVDPDAGN